MSNQDHPGNFIRNNVLPEGMSVTEAARLLGVGRPALSNLLNENSSLSPEMARRFEEVFGTDSQKLIKLQSAFLKATSNVRYTAEVTNNYVKPLFDIKASEIEKWSKSDMNRNRLPILIRTLVNSTGKSLTRVRFPGDELAECHGWDGEVEANHSTKWIPLGKSAWELSTKKKARDKANSDYRKRTSRIDEAECNETTYVCVSSRVFSNKQKWEEKRRQDNNWKDVRVYDVYDLKAWLDQSIPSQVWFANTSKRLDKKPRSLESCWKNWSEQVCRKLFEELFTRLGHVNEQSFQNSFKDYLKEPSVGKPFFVKGDSIEEVLAYLYIQFENGNTDMNVLGDKVVVFDEPGTLSKIDIHNANLIPVITNEKVQHELSTLKFDKPWIRVDFRRERKIWQGFELSPLDSGAFKKTLRDCKISDDKVQRLYQKSGRSLTVLRRELSTDPDIKCPKWVIDRQYSKQLIPIILASAWDSQNKADQAILTKLSGGLSFEKLEQNFREFSFLEDSPVWSAGSFRGVISKIDILFGLSRATDQDNTNRILKEDFDRFIDVLEQTLVVRTPISTEFNDQIPRGMHTDTNCKCSFELVNGMLEILLLFSVYGNSLLERIPGIRWKERIENLVRSILTPLDSERYESLSGFIPLIAEVAPDVFIDVLKQDMESSSSVCRALTKDSTSDVFQPQPDKEMWWALEALAWSPENFEDVCFILADLAKIKINEDSHNPPIGSLLAIFRSRMPQTCVNLNKRIEVVDKLLKNSELNDVVWRLCFSQIKEVQSIGTYNYKPLWRSDETDLGDPVTNNESRKFARHCYDRAVTWEKMDKNKVLDLVSCVMNYSRKCQDRIWDSVENWAMTSDEADKAEVREKIRQEAFTPIAQEIAKRNNRKRSHFTRAKKVYRTLQPSDVVVKHKWLFDGSYDETVFEPVDLAEYDYDKRDEGLRDLRIEAIREILAEEEFDGIVRLIRLDAFSYQVGQTLSEVVVSDEEMASYLSRITQIDPKLEQFKMSSFVRGVLHPVSGINIAKLLSLTISKVDKLSVVPILTNAPFDSKTWEVLDGLKSSQYEQYWKEVKPLSYKLSKEDELEAVRNFLGVKRPRTAFYQAKYDYTRLPAKTLYQVLNDMVEYERGQRINDHNYEYYLRLAFGALNRSGDITSMEMAELEMSYILQFDSGNDYPNLSRMIQTHPSLFIQAVGFGYQREDNGNDPDILRMQSTEEQIDRARKGKKLLSVVNRVPWYAGEEKLDYDKLIEWIEGVRSGGKQIGRVNRTEWAIGKLLAKVESGKDGIWPIEPIRILLEKVMTEEMLDSIRIELYNKTATDVTLYGEGTPRRKLYEKHSQFAEQMMYKKFIKLSNLHTKLAKTYKRDANRRDIGAEVLQRTR